MFVRGTGGANAMPVRACCGVSPNVVLDGAESKLKWALMPRFRCGVLALVNYAPVMVRDGARLFCRGGLNPAASPSFNDDIPRDGAR